LDWKTCFELDNDNSVVKLECNALLSAAEQFTEKCRGRRAKTDPKLE